MSAVEPWTPTTEQVRGSYPLSDADMIERPGLAWNRILTVDGFDRWLEGERERIRVETLEVAAARVDVYDWRHYYMLTPGALLRLWAKKREQWERIREGAR